MRTEYGAWKENTSVHAIGYDGKWLCGKEGKPSTECSENVIDINCKHCLKKLPEYAIKMIVPSSNITDLKESRRAIQQIIANIRGEKSTCNINDIPPRLELYLKTWILPGIEQMLRHFEGDTNDGSNL